MKDFKLTQHGKDTQLAGVVYFHMDESATLDQAQTFVTEMMANLFHEVSKRYEA